jgi:glycosyltransferase 2 family protein
VGIGVLVVAAIVLFRMRGASFQWNLFLSTLRHVGWTWLLISILLMLLTYVGRALRWRVMLGTTGRTLSLWKLTSDTAIGFMAAVLLGRVGEVVRPYLISISAGVSFSSQLAAWFLERLLDLLAVLLIFGFALTRIPSHGLPLGPGLRWALGAGGYAVAILGVACVGLLILFRHFPDIAERRILSALVSLPEIYYKRSKQVLSAFSQGVSATRSGRVFGQLVLYTTLEWLIIAGSYYALFQSFAVTTSLKITDIVVILGFLAFGSVVQIPGIGGGIQITAIVVFTQIYSLPLETASGIAVFIWVLTFAVVVPFGLLCALLQGWNWRKIKQLTFEQLPAEEGPL